MKQLLNIGGLHNSAPSLFFPSPGSVWLHRQRPDPGQPDDACALQRRHQTRCHPAPAGRGPAPAQEPVPARRSAGGVPGAVSRQDPASVPRDHQAQPGPVLAGGPGGPGGPGCSRLAAATQTQPLPKVLASQPVTTSYCVWSWCRSVREGLCRHDVHHEMRLGQEEQSS